MSSTEKFCLRWNDFESNISKAFSEIREDKEFFDVTLACDDDQVPAHKVILSACSPFFRGVLRRNKHEHPLLYLKGVKYSDLLAVLNFMYHGEVNVAQEDLNTFLAVAEDLKVKGLTQSDSSSVGGSNNSSGQSTPGRPTGKSKSRDPADTASATSMGPPTKKLRSNSSNQQQTPSAAVTHLSSANHDDMDEIQDVTPVKTEPIATLPADNNVSAMATPPVIADTSATQQQHYGTELVDAEYADDYGDYGDTGYDADGTYDDSTIVDPNTASTDGNKEVWDFVRSMMSVEFDVNNLKRHVCVGCRFQSRNSSNLRSHVEAKHLPMDQFYRCDICACKKRTWQRLLGHMRESHSTSAAPSLPSWSGPVY